MPTDEVDERDEVWDVVGQWVVAALGPFGVAMAPQVTGNHVVVIAERLGQTIPVAGVVASAMHEDQRRVGGISPRPVGQAEALGLVIVLPGLRQGVPPDVRTVSAGRG